MPTPASTFPSSNKARATACAAKLADSVIATRKVPPRPFSLRDLGCQLSGGPPAHGCAGGVSVRASRGPCHPRRKRPRGGKLGQAFAAGTARFFDISRNRQRGREDRDAHRPPGYTGESKASRDCLTPKVAIRCGAPTRPLAARRARRCTCCCPTDCAPTCLRSASGDVKTAASLDCPTALPRCRTPAARSCFRATVLPLDGFIRLRVQKRSFQEN